MNRSSWKSPFVSLKILICLKNKKKLSDKLVFTKSRSSTILRKFIGWNFYVHRGNRYNRVIINNLMVGHKLGEFSFTRRIGKIHGMKKMK